MTDFYDEMDDVAAELLTEFNQADYRLTRAGAITQGENEWDEPSQSPPQTWTLFGISEAVEAKYADGDTVKITDRQIMVAPFDDKPQAGDVLAVNGEVATVLDIKPITERGCAWLFIIKG